MSAQTSEKIQQVRDFVLEHQHGVLSTVSSSHDSYPFGSVTPYDVDDKYRVVIFISNIAEHYRNLVADSRSSLCIVARDGDDDPQAHARATLLGCFTQVSQDECESVAEQYWKRFPNAVSRQIAHTFHYFRMEVERVRWIGGFGEIRWVSGKDYALME